MDISVVIITLNEEKNLARCLTSVAQLANEIVVVDSFSTDGTEAIAKQHDARFIQHQFEGHIEQKNYAISQAKNDIILSLDADECLSAELAASIKSLTNLDPQKAYRMNRLTNYCGQWIHHCGWYPDAKVRLFHRSTAHWGGQNPHDKIIVDQGVQVLDLVGDLKHYSYYTIGEHLVQIDKFSTIAANELVRKNNTQYLVLKMCFSPTFSFVKSYLVQLGFLDGRFGFIVCVLSAYYRFVKYAKVFMMIRQGAVL